jgi:putative addiction module component (TIGR02574 family)
MTALDIARLSPQERLDLIGQLWDSLDAKDIRLTPVQEAELDRRLATFDGDIKAGVTWEDIETALDRRYP